MGHDQHRPVGEPLHFQGEAGCAPRHGAVPDVRHGADHGHGHGAGPHHHDFRAASRRALVVAGIFLGVIFLVELVGGLLTGSLALLADAGHLLTDVAAVGLALLAQWFGGRPASARRSYGFRRVEILAALINGFSLWVIAGGILWQASVRLVHPTEVASLSMVIIAAIGLVVQTAVAVVLARAAGESLNAKGAYVHAATDAVQSAGVVIAGLAMMATGWWILDPLISMAIALLILVSGGKIVWEASHVLMEGTPTELDLEDLARVLGDEPGVAQVSDLHAWSITTGYNALSAHIVVTPSLDAEARETLQGALRHRLQERFPVHHVTLQVERECELCRDRGCAAWIPTGAAKEIKV